MAKERVRAKTSLRGYGARHQWIRRALEPLVRAGLATCARCQRRILPGEPWDLDHDDDDPLQRRYLGPSHRRCNRAVVTHFKEALIPETQRHSRDW